LVDEQHSEPETLAETYARLSTRSPGVPMPPEPPRPMPLPPLIDDDELPGTDATAPDPRSGANGYPAPSDARAAGSGPRAGAGLFVLIAAGSLVVLVLLLVAAVWGWNLLARNDAPEPVGPLSTAAPGDESDPSADAWTSYPGTAYDDSAAILAQPTKEEVVARNGSLADALERKLTESYGASWSTSFDGYDSVAVNGYGGDSMLSDWSAPERVGTFVLDDPSARADIAGQFAALAAAAGFDDVWLSNELYENDPDSARQQFGAAAASDQALWRVYASSSTDPSTSITVRIFDSNLPTDPGFDTGLWIDAADVPAGSVVVAYSIYSHGLLADADRQQFTDRLGQFDESAKPEPR
jgi:hypothetical protein